MRIRGREGRKHSNWAIWGSGRLWEEQKGKNRQEIYGQMGRGKGVVFRYLVPKTNTSLLRLLLHFLLLLPVQKPLLELQCLPIGI